MSTKKEGLLDSLVFAICEPLFGERLGRLITTIVVDSVAMLVMAIILSYASEALADILYNPSHAFLRQYLLFVHEGVGIVTGTALFFNFSITIFNWLKSR